MQNENVVAKINVIDVRPGADGCRTGKGVGFLTESAALADFEARKKEFSVASETGAFILDLHIDDDIVDTIEITEDGFRAIVGEEPATVEQNREFDRLYWENVKKLAHATAAKAEQKRELDRLYLAGVEKLANSSNV